MEEGGDSVNFLLSDFNTRLRDIDERNKLVRERVLLLGKNFIATRQELSDEIKEIRAENSVVKKDIQDLKRVANNLLTEFNQFIKRDEVMVIERMLKDFQPLDFLRRKDIEDLIEDKIKENSKKQIKSSKTNK